MKKVVALLTVTVMLFSLAACGGQPSNGTSSNSNEVSNSPTPGTVSEPKDITHNFVKADTIEELNNLVLKDVSDTIDGIKKEYEELTTSVDTFDKYVNGTEIVEGFYNKTQNETELLCIRLREYSVAYAELILSSDNSEYDKYDDLDELYDNVYNDARDEVYDEIYDGVLDDIYKVFYNGILDDAYDSVSYEDWSDARSDEYELWSDTRSEVYDIWSDSGSDIYDFWSDMKTFVYRKDEEKANNRVEKFKGKIEELYKKAEK